MIPREARELRDLVTGRRAARRVVCVAIERGELAPATRFPCSDLCGRQAAVYDHRDYGRPLHVEPVCKPCNKARGPATPQRRTLEQCRALLARRPAARPVMDDVSFEEFGARGLTPRRAVGPEERERLLEQAYRAWGYRPPGTTLTTS